MMLQLRMLDIASGRTDLPAEKVRAYRERWRRQGYALPAWENEPAVESSASATPAAEPRQQGVGTEFQQLAAEFGIRSRKTCGCRAIKKLMNGLSLDELSQRREELLELLRKNYRQLRTSEKIHALLTGGLPAWLNPADPLGSMLDEAIRRHATRLTASEA